MSSKRVNQAYLDKIASLTFGSGAKPKKAQPQPQLPPEAMKALQKAVDARDPGYNHEVEVVKATPVVCEDCGTEALMIAATERRTTQTGETSLSA